MDNIALVKMDLMMEVDESAIKEIEKLTHHIEYLLDLDSYPEIKSVFNVNVTKIIKPINVKGEDEDEQ